MKAILFHTSFGLKQCEGECICEELFLNYVKDGNQVYFATLVCRQPAHFISAPAHLSESDKDSSK